MKRIWTRILVGTAMVALAPALHAQRADAPEVLFRLDDIGMNHSVNVALEEVAKTGLSPRCRVQNPRQSTIRLARVEERSGCGNQLFSIRMGIW